MRKMRVEARQGRVREVRESVVGERERARARARKRESRRNTGLGTRISALLKECRDVFERKSCCVRWIF